MEYHFDKLIELAKDKNVIIDVGVNEGSGTTRAFLKAMEQNPSEDKILIGIDFEDKIVDRPLVPYWKFIIGDSQSEETIIKCMEALQKKDLFERDEILNFRKADIIMIDTVHSYNFIKKELPLWNQLADKNTIWLFHDTFMFDCYNPMTDAIKEFAAENNWEFTEITPKSHGLGMLTYKK